MSIGFLQGRFLTSRFHVLNTIHYLDRQSPLFTAGSELACHTALEEYKQYEPHHVWENFFSLSRTDAERLNIDREYYKDLLALYSAQIAKTYNVSPENLKIIASWHNKDHHPHVHILFYSTDPREGFLFGRSEDEDNAHLNKASERVKSLFVNEIFKNDMKMIKETKSQQRINLNVVLANEIDKIAAGSYKLDTEIVGRFETLVERLNGITGKKQYGYLPPELKKEVDDLLRTIVNKDPVCARLFAEYCGSQEMLTRFYAEKDEVIGSKMIKYQERFFSPSKKDDTSRHNLIIKAATAWRPAANEESAASDQTETDVYFAVDNQEKADAILQAIVNGLIEKRCNTLPRGSVRQLAEHRKMLYNNNAPHAARQKAAEGLLNAANQGNDYAQYHLANAFYTGTFFNLDNTLAYEYFSRAAQQGNIHAAYKLGKLLLDKKFPLADPTRAANIFEAIAEESEAATYALADMYCKGQGREQNIEKAIALFSKIDGDMRPYTQYQLGNIYMSESAFQDEAKGVAAFLQIEGELKPTALYRLGSIYMSNSPFKNETKAIDYFLQVEGEQKSAARYQLGNIYISESPLKDETLGIQYYKEALKKGNLLAKYKLAKIYMAHTEDPSLQKKAAEYFSSLMASSEQVIQETKLDDWSQYFYAKMLFWGAGVERDQPSALAHMKCAAEKGNTTAAAFLKRARQYQTLYQAKTVLEAARSLTRLIAQSIQPPTPIKSAYKAQTRIARQRWRDKQVHDRQEEQFNT